MAVLRQFAIIFNVKYLVIADLHGSEFGLANLKRAIKMHNPDILILLGDLLRGGYGGSEDVLIFLRDSTIPKFAVLGNTDFAGDAYSLGFDLPYSRNLPFGEWTIEMQHTPFYGSGLPKRIYVNGHTHRKSLRKEGDQIYLNPGSIALPRDNCPGYAILEDKKITLYDAFEGKEIESIDL